MTIKVTLQPQVYQTNLDNMLFGSFSETLGSFKGVPSGKFTNISDSVTQFTSNATSFLVETDSLGEIHTIKASLVSNQSGANLLAVRGRISEKQFIPTNKFSVVSVPLLKGENQIEVFTDKESSFTSVIASHAGTFVTSYARELFNSTQNPLNEQTSALFNAFSSRISEILIPFQDLYADPKALRDLISKFIIKAYVAKTGSTAGVRDFVAALLGTTPIFVPTQTDPDIFEPAVVPLFKSQLEFGGYEAHTWIPNFEITHWLSFVRLLNNARDFYQIQEIGEQEILVIAGGTEERHLFNFDTPAATAYSEFSFTDFRVTVEIFSSTVFKMCAAAYPFDLFVEAASLLLDGPIIDPGEDGWLGIPLSGRFEQLSSNTNPVSYALDSLFIVPDLLSGLQECVYDGFYTQTVSTTSSSLDIPVSTEDSLSIDGDENNILLEENPVSVIVPETLVGVSGTSLAQKFQLAVGSTIKKTELHLASTGSPVGYLIVSLHDDHGGKPGSVLARAPARLVQSVVSGSADFYGFNFIATPALSAATPYWIVLSGDPAYTAGPPAVSGTHNIGWNRENGGYPHSRARTTAALDTSSGNLWTVTANEHHFFKIVGI